MKKNLRMLCLGLAAATFTASFAQENVTSKLLNADMEKGVLGWDITFDSNIWVKQKKGQTSYHGFNENCLQNWKSDASTGLTDNTITQTVKGLPNGTYVFGAYIAAAKNDSTENANEVIGVNLYANEAFVPVATNWPEHTSQKWSHSARFDVATTVTDGTLTVGLKAEATNANFIIWDNATLYFFGDMSTDEALNEMAKINLANNVALADTCKNHVYNVDSVAQLNAAIEAAKAVTGVDGAYEADENLWWAFRQARASINDYRGFNSAIAHAEEMANAEWSVDQSAEAVDALKELVAASKEMYTAAASNRAEVNAQKEALTESAAVVAMDSMWVKMDQKRVVVEEIVPGNEEGEYSSSMVLAMSDLLDEVETALNEVNEGAITAVRGHVVCDSLFALLQNVFDNPIVYDNFPIVIGRSETAVQSNYKLLEGAVLNADNQVSYTSKVYRFREPLTKVRFIIKETGSNVLQNGYPFTSLSSFEMFDEDGNEIDLDGIITTNADHNALNSTPDGQGIPGLLDDDPGTFFHSAWGNGPAEYHYLEVTLPENEYSAFSFAMAARSSSHPHQFPAVIEVTYISDMMGALISEVSNAQSMLPVQEGTTPGFYSIDTTPFKEALAAAEAIVAAGVATDGEIEAAIAALEAARGDLSTALIMPQPGKEYRIISAGPFFANQGVHKALTVHSDTSRVNWIWWETASPDSAQQVFTFEYIENEDGLPYYAVKHKATGLYIGELFDEDGEVIDNTAGLNAEKDTVEVKTLGLGQFGLFNNGQFHTGDHNGGTVATGSNVYGCADHAVLGDKSGICKWSAAANSGSAWFIREMQTLPYAAKSISDLKFQSEPISLYEGVNTLTLTADKECAFADLVVYGSLGEEISASVSQSGAVATVILDTMVVETFSFSFANTEAVQTVTVDGIISKLSILQSRYDAAIAVNPVQGDEIGLISDLSEYNKAIAAAEALLLNGGSDEAIQQAANDLDTAVAHLAYNLPLADKEYFLVSALDAFKENHGIDVVIYAKETAAAWSYVNVNNLAYRWKFVETDPLYSARVFYLQNVGTGTYMGSSDAYSTALEMVPEPSATQPFRIDVWDGTILTICDGRYSNGNLHLNGHNSGKNAYGNIVYWSSTVGTASAFRIVEAEKYIKDFVDGIEDVEIADEYVAPAKKGIYDLYGRRLEAPAATGIYIVDGKKRVIKK